ncbi:26S proteasome regulatory subunit 8 homolog B-like protein [Tanacetum coccineum]
MNLMRGIDLKKIAEKMNCASGAELKAVCTEAGMFALRERRVHVTQEDFEMAVAKLILLVPQRLLLSLNCLYLLFVTVLASKSVIEPETAIVTEPETATVTGAETAVVTQAETAIVTEAETATVPETVLVTEPVTGFVIVIETGSLAPGLRFENPVVQFQEPPVWT